MKKITCPKCKGENINIQLVETGTKTKKTGVGFVGSTYNSVRGFMNVASLGVAGKIMPKATGKEKTKIKTEKVAICQSCGHSWKV